MTGLGRSIFDRIGADSRIGLVCLVFCVVSVTQGCSSGRRAPDEVPDPPIAFLHWTGKAAPNRILVDSEGSVVFGDGRLVAVVDVPGIAVVDTPDALLVVSRDGSEKVRKVVDELKRKGRKDLL